jgi:uncharacterized protein (DUF1330 family)
MSMYFIVQVKMKNAEIYKKYLEECDQVFEKYKGKYLAVDDKYIVVEGTVDCSRIVIISFENEDDFNDWYYSEDYQRIVKYRVSGAECNSVLVHGKVE